MTDMEKKITWWQWYYIHKTRSPKKNSGWLHSQNGYMAPPKMTDPIGDHVYMIHKYYLINRKPLKYSNSHMSGAPYPLKIWGRRTVPLRFEND